MAARGRDRARLHEPRTIEVLSKDLLVTSRGLLSISTTFESATHDVIVHETARPPQPGCDQVPICLPGQLKASTLHRDGPTTSGRWLFSGKFNRYEGFVLLEAISSTAADESSSAQAHYLLFTPSELLAYRSERGLSSNNIYISPRQMRDCSQYEVPRAQLGFRLTQLYMQALDGNGLVSWRVGWGPAPGATNLCTEAGNLLFTQALLYDRIGLELSPALESHAEHDALLLGKRVQMKTATKLHQCKSLVYQVHVTHNADGKEDAPYCGDAFDALIAVMPPGPTRGVLWVVPAAELRKRHIMGGGGGALNQTLSISGLGKGTWRENIIWLIDLSRPMSAEAVQRTVAEMKRRLGIQQGQFEAPLFGLC